MKKKQLSREKETQVLKELEEVKRLSINLYINSEEMIYKGVHILTNVYAGDNITPIIADILKSISTQFNTCFQKKKEKIAKLPSYERAFLRYCLGLVQTILQNNGYSGNSKQQFKIAHLLDRKNPQVCLLLAFYDESIEYLNKIDFQQAIKSVNRNNILKILNYRIPSPKNSLSVTENQTNNQISKQFKTKILNFKVTLLSKLIEQYPQQSLQNSLILALSLYDLNRFDQSLDCALSLKEKDKKQSINSAEIYSGLGQIFSKLNRLQQCIEYERKAIKLNERLQAAYQVLIDSLTRVSNLEEAEILVSKLKQINASNGEVYNLLGRIKFLQGKQAEAIEIFQFTIKKGESSEFVYRNLGYSLMSVGKIHEAIKYYFKCIQIKPIAYDYFQLALCYQKLGRSLTSIQYYKKAIGADFLQLHSYINLSNIAKLNPDFQSNINQFMLGLKADPNSNLYVQFNVAIYFYLSKQSYYQFHSFLLSFLNEDGEGKIYSDIVNSTLMQYRRLTNKTKFNNSILSLIIGILSKAKGNKAQAHDCYVNLFGKYKIKSNQSASTTFTHIYQQLIREVPKDSISLFLQFLTTEMLHQNPKQALKCYYKSLNYIQNDYDYFKQELQVKLQQSIQSISLMISVIKNIKSITQKQLIYKKSSIINLQKFNQAVTNMKKSLNLFKQFDSLDNFNQIKHILNLLRSSQEDEQTNRDVFSDIYTFVPWKCKIATDSCYYKLWQQISRQEQIMVRRMGEILTQHGKNMHQCISEMARVFEELMDGSLVVNEAIKIIFNDISQFIFNDQAHYQFSKILHKFKSNKGIEDLVFRQQLLLIFKENSKITKTNEQSSISFFTLLTKKSHQKLISIKSNALSQIDVRQDRLGFKYIRQIKPQYSESNNSEIEMAQNIKFIEEEKKKKDKMVLRLVKAPFKKSQISSITFKQADMVGQQQQFEDLQEGFTSSSKRSSLMQRKEIEFKLESIKFRNKQKQLYRQFNKFCYLNTFYIIKYISTVGQKKLFIAKHYCETKQIIKQSGWIQPSFKAQVQMGDKKFSRINTKNISQIHRLWEMGSLTILTWIHNIALGIVELQLLGIYHADLEFRNTIKQTLEQIFVFKIIDFDKAFKTINTSKVDKAYQQTLKMIDFWLRFTFVERHHRAPIYQLPQNSESSFTVSLANSYHEEEIILYLFKGADNQLMSKLLNTKHSEKIKYEQKKQQCVNLLQQHMKKSHFVQFSSLVKQLFSNQILDHQNNREIMQKSEIDQVLNLIQELKQSCQQDYSYSYQSFAQKIKAIIERRYRANNSQ